MKLTYRGVGYDLIPTPVTLDDDFIEGKYRGLPIEFHRAEANVPHPAFSLKYRGVAYQTNKVSGGAPRGRMLGPRGIRGVAYQTNKVSGGARDVSEPAAVPGVAIAPETPATPIASANSIEERARLLMMNHHRRVIQRDQSMLMRLDKEVGLEVEDATHFWNQIQGKVHSEAWATYDRSHAAMS